MVMTADGFIAKDSAQASIDWTSSADKQIFVERTKSAGAIIMGLATYKTINRPLPGRLNIVLTLDPETEQNIDGQLEYTNKKPQEILTDLEARGYSEVILGGGTTINSLFLEQNLIDELQITIEPIIFGGGLTLFRNIDVNKKLELLETKDLGDGVSNLKYRIIK